MYAVLLKIDFLTPLRFLACFSSEKSRFDDPEPRGAARGREQVEKRRRHAAEKRLAECSKKLERASRHFQGEVTARRLREQELGQTRLEMSRLCVPLSHPRIVTAHPLSPSHCCIGLPSLPPRSFIPALLPTSALVPRTLADKARSKQTGGPSRPLQRCAYTLRHFSFLGWSAKLSNYQRGL